MFADGWLPRGELVRYEHSVTSVRAVFFRESRQVNWTSPETASGSLTCLIPGALSGAVASMIASACSLYHRVLAFLSRWSPDGTHIAYDNIQSGAP